MQRVRPVGCCNCLSPSPQTGVEFSCARLSLLQVFASHAPTQQAEVARTTGPRAWLVPPGLTTQPPPSIHSKAYSFFVSFQQAEVVAQTEAEFQDLEHLKFDVKSW